MDESAAGKAIAGIVVGVDGSPLSVEALRWAMKLEPAVGGPITAAIAWQFPAAAVLGAYPSMEWSPEADAREVLQKTIEDAYGDSPPEGLKTLVASGPAAHVLIEATRQARLLIVGSRGLGGFMGLMLGSVSAACAEHAGCPVLVLHTPEDSKAAPTASAAAPATTASA